MRDSYYCHNCDWEPLVTPDGVCADCGDTPEFIYEDEARVSINDIKKNGICPKSKLFWALAPHGVNYICLDSHKNVLGYSVDPRIGGILIAYLWKDYFGSLDSFGFDIGIKTKYTGDWKDSLHFRGDYE
tara:strand:+ start:1382 stop:1768 length:387 start_codon:yes stop_codon:yes gene_type:complete